MTRTIRLPAGAALGLAVLLLAWPALRAEESESEARMRKDLTYLSGDECEGRGVETKGIKLAADYIAAEFKKAGLKPGGVNGTYFQPFEISGPAISRHLKVLEEAQLIDRRVDARWRVCSLRRDRLAEAERWISDTRQFWERGFDRLEALLKAQDPSHPPG